MHANLFSKFRFPFNNKINLDICSCYRGSLHVSSIKVINNCKKFFLSENTRLRKHQPITPQTERERKTNISIFSKKKSLFKTSIL